MLGMNDMKIGTLIVHDGAPHEVLEAHHVKMQQRRPVMQTRIRNLVTGNVLPITFQTHSKIEAAEIERREIMFIYKNHGEYFFHEINDKAKRFTLKADVIGALGQYLKGNTPVTAVVFNNQIINIEIPVKMDFNVTEAPPAFRGDTATGGTKEVIIETGAKIKTPMFIEEGEKIRVNTRTGEYVERA